MKRPAMPRPNRLNATIFIAAYASWTGVTAQIVSSPASPAETPLACARVSDAGPRLACFDAWAARQTGWAAAQAQPVAAVAPVSPVAADQANRPTITLQASPSQAAPANARPPAPASAQTSETATADWPAHDCRRAQTSAMDRFWELSSASDCGTWAIRGYKPISLMLSLADTVNPQPSSPAPGHTADSATDWRPIEAHLQLSMRTKLAQGLFTHASAQRRDSLWFGYTQASNWQLFSPELSRPFRSTDHEPELIYIAPISAPLPAGWVWRYAGASLNHQSNGQSLPLSRSWNRLIGLAGFERGADWQLNARVWARLPEPESEDDNPDLIERSGRAELRLSHALDTRHSLGLLLRHPLRNSDGGAWQLEWLYRPGPASPLRQGLRLHAQLSSGWSESLIDYNQHRSVLRLGLSLVDW